MIYQPPLRDYRFLLESVLATEFAQICHELDMDDIVAILDEAGRFAVTRIQPFNHAMSETGCSLEHGRVRVPPQLREAFVAYAAAGWIGLSAAREHGGQGLPNVLALAVADMLNASSIAFADYVGLMQFGYLLMAAHGDDTLKSRYLHDLAVGRIGAAMCITEPHCGTDVGLLSTRATPMPDGRYALHGNKIFVSAGDQDLTDNIVYFVLARLPDAPKGAAGVSLFCVPRFTDAGANALTTVSIEKKMGYSASATCQISFEGAAGWLMGKAGRGLSAMFTMIANARIATAAQGIGAAEIACQNASAYALSRLQGRAPGGARCPEMPADPIIVHPDVRRLLIGTRAYVEGARAAYLWAGCLMDIARGHSEMEERQRASALLMLVTGPMKAVFSDLGFQACNDCMQIFGGHGYIRETGMEQLVRDVRLSQIQEGANGMLAYDLLRRHLLDPSGAYRHLIAEMRQTTMLPLHDEKVAILVQKFAALVDDLELAAADMFDQSGGEPDYVAAMAHDFQRIFGIALLGWFWARMAIAAELHPDGNGRRKWRTARFFFEYVVPATKGHMAVIRGGARSIVDIDDGHFDDQMELAIVS